MVDIRFGPPQNPWTDQDDADQQQLLDAIRDPLTKYVLDTRRTSPVLELAEREPTPELEFDIQMKRVTGDEWRNPDSSITCVLAGPFMFTYGWLHRTWPYKVQMPGYTILDGRFVIDILDWAGSPPRDVRPARVSALRPYNDGGDHLLVTCDADVRWDERGTPTLSWLPDPAIGKRWIPL